MKIFNDNKKYFLFIFSLYLSFFFYIILSIIHRNKKSNQIKLFFKIEKIKEKVDLYKKSFNDDFLYRKFLKLNLFLNNIENEYKILINSPSLPIRFLKKIPNLYNTFYFSQKNHDLNILHQKISNHENYDLNLEIAFYKYDFQLILHNSIKFLHDLYNVHPYSTHLKKHLSSLIFNNILQMNLLYIDYSNNLYNIYESFLDVDKNKFIENGKSLEDEIKKLYIQNQKLFISFFNNK